MEKIGIIWTLDRICEWSCDCCCVDAFGIKKEKNKLIIKSNRFNFEEENTANNLSDLSKRAQKILRENNLALPLEKKLKILDNLKGANVEIGFSGGDLLLNDENLEVIQKASEMIGKENIGLTATGVGMRIGHIERYLDHIAQLEFTYDNVDANDENHMQPGYNSSNLAGFRKIIDVCKEKGVVTQGLIPISNSNKSPQTIDRLYSTLHEIGVEQVYLMRTFPVGRAFGSRMDALSVKEYRQVIGRYYELEKEKSGPRVNIMCALKGLFPEKWNNPCTVLKSTVDITSTGDLIIDAFAYGLKGEALRPDLIFGNLTENHLIDLLARPRVEELKKRADENPGHCKIFAYLNSQKEGIDGFFDKTDSLIEEQRPYFPE